MGGTPQFPSVPGVYDGLYEAGSKLAERLGYRQLVDYKRVGMRDRGEGQ
jgi:hypothetical protein